MSRLIAILMTLALTGAGVSHAGPVRIASFNAELTRKGPGLLLADILKSDEQVMAVAEVIATVAPDVLLLVGFDHDRDGHALRAFAELLEARGISFPYRFSARPNSGIATGVDLDGDGTTHEARDSQGYGSFSGSGGMAVLSRHPIGDVRDFSAMLWADLPGNIAPEVDGKPFPSAAARAVQRLSSVAHWDVPIEIPGGPLHLLAFHATTPVFDGPEDLNGRRNHDEIVFWQRLLDAELPFAPPAGPVVILGDANLDPVDGDGRIEAIQGLLADPRVQDPAPRSDGGKAAANREHRGDPSRDTVDWSDPRPGNLRVDYILPDARLGLVDAGVFWPAPGDDMEAMAELASRHRMVWVDIALD